MFSPVAFEREFEMADRTEYFRIYNKKVWAEQKGEMTERHRAWRTVNKERRNAYAREWHAKQIATNEKEYREKTRKHRLKRLYGITSDDYDRLLSAQGGHCALCDRTPDQERHGYLHVDHCHDTSKVRGLLCEQHNLALGKLGDSEDAILRALNYLRGTGI